ncbi:alpha/beta hydrolase [Legionella sp. CNM-1927-20]|uniref:alpha/beta hydrolase n=1 Tax=Legionella sp. CNM-1927-20 TaxID=3422221 RepID=UPI00403B1B5D
MLNIRGFFNTAKQFIQDNQPVSLTGALIHPYYWLMSKSNDYVCDISNLNSTDELKTRAYVIPGTADFPFSLFRMVDRILAKGKLNDIKSFTIVSFFKRFQGKSIDDFSQELLDKIKADQVESIILIGHSRGGLIAAKTALEAAKLGIKVKAVITLATPFNGSHLALPPLTWFSASIKQMEVGNTYLKELGDLILRSEIPHYFMVAGNDEVVRSGAFIKDYVEKYPDSMTVFPRHGHLSLVSSHKLVEKIHTLVTGKNLKEVKQTLEEGDNDDLFNLFDEVEITEAIDLVTEETARRSITVS